MRCETERLEQLLDGELAAEAFTETEAHLQTCADCRQELDWLRAERRLMSARRLEVQGPSAGSWAAIEARLGRTARPVVEDQPRRASLFWGIFGGFATLSAAAAAIVALILPPGTVVPWNAEQAASALASRADDLAPPDPERPRRSRQNLRDAEKQYRSAIRELEEDYQSRRRTLPAATTEKLDQQFAELRQTINVARRVANGSVEARRRTLDAYAAYVHSMQLVAFEQDL
jgi:Putative zinc-finger